MRTAAGAGGRITDHRHGNGEIVPDLSARLPSADRIRIISDDCAYNTSGYEAAAAPQCQAVEDANHGCTAVTRACAPSGRGQTDMFRRPAAVPRQAATTSPPHSQRSWVALRRSLNVAKYAGSSLMTRVDLTVGRVGGRRGAKACFALQTGVT